MRHQAFVIGAETEEGITIAQSWAEHELDIKVKNNPDVVVLRYGLLSVEDARRITELSLGAPFSGEHKVVIISASRAYHEAQNALLKLFEEPPRGTYLFFILPTLGGLLPTLRSRVSVFSASKDFAKLFIADVAQQFIKASHEKRTAIIKKLASGKDEEERRENRDEVLQIVNGIEAVAYGATQERKSASVTELLSDIAVLRGHLYDRSAPVRMILEHLSLVIPKDLSARK